VNRGCSPARAKPQRTPTRTASVTHFLSLFILSPLYLWFREFLEEDSH
jgi:hypothetical protein